MEKLTFIEENNNNKKPPNLESDMPGDSSKQPEMDSRNGLSQLPD